MAKIKARELLDGSDVNRLPIDVDRLAVDLNVVVEYRPLVTDGSITKCKGSYVIAVDSNASGNRRRFTLAHELGHMQFDLLHRSVRPMDGNRLGLDYSERYRQGIRKIADASEEQFCNWFASFLLIPDDAIADICNWNTLTPEVLRNRATALMVSVQALAWRMLEEIGDSGGFIQFGHVGKPSNQADLKWRVTFSCFPATDVFIPKLKSVPCNSPLADIFERKCFGRLSGVDLSVLGLLSPRILSVDARGETVDVLVLPSNSGPGEAYPQLVGDLGSFMK